MLTKEQYSSIGQALEKALLVTDKQKHHLNLEVQMMRKRILNLQAYTLKMKDKAGKREK
jgi:hypothetical protein